MQIQSNSQLQTHIKILQKLAQEGPLKLNQLKQKLEIESQTTKKHLSYLVEKDFVKEKTTGNNQSTSIYLINNTGLCVLKYFKIPIPQQKQSKK